MLAKLQQDELDPSKLSPAEMKMFLEFVKTEAKTCLRECQPLWEVDDGAYDIGVEEVSEIVEDLSKVDDKKDRNIDLEELFEKETYDLEEEIDIADLKKSRNGLRRRVKELPDIPMFKRLTADRFVVMFYNVANIAYAFCYLYRQFNGDLKNNSADICRLSYHLAPCLRNDWKQFYPNLKAALRSDLLRQVVGLNNSWIERGLLLDTAKVIRNRFLTCEQLHLVYDCFHREFEKVDRSNLTSEKANKSRVQLNATLQKLIFFITLVRELPQEAVLEVKNELELLIKESEAIEELKTDALAK